MSDTKAPTFGLDGFKTVGERLTGDRERRRALAERVIPFNITFLDDVALGIYPTDLIVLCAATGAGKTTAAALISQIASAQNRRVHYFALEAHRGEIEQRMLFREVGQVLAEEGRRGRMRFNEWMYGRLENQIGDRVEDEAEQRIRDCGTVGMRTFYREKPFTPDDIRSLLPAIQNDTDLVVIDHLHYVDSDDRDENRALREATRAIRDTALMVERPVIVVAHMRKKDRSGKPKLVPELDDVHGSSDIVKMATKVVMLAPSRDKVATARGIANTYVRVAKDRFAGDEGFTARMQYDLRTLRYAETYRLGRLSFMGDEFNETEGERLPEWAKHAVGYNREQQDLGADW